MTVDLRSDFCAPPTDEMWEAMRSARFGWASAGEDENVNRLERRGAALLGKEAAVFVPTCTTANIAALLAHGIAGQSVVVERSAHVMTSESLGISELAGLVPFPVDAERGRLDPGVVDRALRRSGAALLCLENTHTRAGGTVTDVALTEALASVARRYGARIHLDGARLPNAAVALGVPLAALAAPVDTVALSLNKGLCAPFGALLAGDLGTIEAARLHVRRLGGGTIHKAGILAAAGLLALDLVDRLAEDHRRAKALAASLGLAEPETNIVLTQFAASALPDLATRGVLAFAPDGERVRLVTHRGIGDEDVERAGYAVAELVTARG
jgi:threonine aldolase